jgi:S-adenosylmethionine decarboxylase
MKKYLPGSHIIATLQTEYLPLLETYAAYKTVIDNLISKYKLTKLGEVYHNFDPTGFTGVICLSESHISIHTWPEHGKINLDIYLSNYLRDNDGTVDSLLADIHQFFGGSLQSSQKIKR